MKLDFSELLKEKKSQRKQIIKALQLPKTIRAIVFCSLADADLQKEITKICSEIDVACIDSLPSFDMFLGLDMLLGDSFSSIIQKQISDNLIVPIFPKNSKNLETFNPMKFEWNAFLFTKKSSFSIFEQICHCLENANYSGDRRMLLKNIFSLNNPEK